MALRNNAGGYYNHKIFWEVMNPNKENVMSEGLKTAIDDAFGSFEAFKEVFPKPLQQDLVQVGHGFASKTGNLKCVLLLIRTIL